MKLPFQNKRKQPQPIIDPHDSDTVVMPVPATTTMPTVKPVEPEPVILIQCAHCHVAGATHIIHSGDFYIGAVDFYLCDICHEQRNRKHFIHVTSQRKTRIETPAVRKPGIAIVGEPGPEIVALPRDAVVMPKADVPTFLDGRELA